MKYVTFAIMAVLIFGVAAAPIFSNGMVFAQTEKEVAIEKKEKTAAKKEVSTEKKQVSTEKKEKTAAKKKIAEEIQEQRRAELEERRAELEEKRDAQQEKRDAQQEKRDTQQEKRTAAKELEEKRHAASEEKKRLLKAKLDEQVRIDRERMQERIDAMKNRSPMTDAINRLNPANSLCGAGTIFDDASNSCVLGKHQNTPLDKTGTYFEKLRHTIAEQKRSQDNLFRQITMLMNLVDSMCEGKVIVAGVSDGKLRCIDSDRAFNMHSRGLVILVE